MNIDEVQRRLWEQSQTHKQNRDSGTPLFPTNRYEGRIGNLMDLMHNPTWIAAACDRVLERSLEHEFTRVQVWQSPKDGERLAELPSAMPSLSHILAYTFLRVCMSVLLWEEDRRH